VGDRLVDLVSLAVVAVVGVRLVQGVVDATRGPGRELARTVVRRIRVRHVWPIPFVLGAVLAAAVVLMSVPGMDWGWWSALGGEGNPVFGTTESTSGTWWAVAIPVTFMLLLLAALPLFAVAEEQIFRAGAERWSVPRRIAKAVQFGLAHAIVGIPIGAALALSIGGVWFQHVYLGRYRLTHDQRDALLESAAAHTAYNATIVVLVLAAVAIGG
jgi:hypothetical protein